MYTSPAMKGLYIPENSPLRQGVGAKTAAREARAKRDNVYDMVKCIIIASAIVGVLSLLGDLGGPLLVWAVVLSIPVLIILEIFTGFVSWLFSRHTIILVCVVLITLRVFGVV